MIRPEHLIIAPILIPFLAGAVMLFYEDRQRRLKLTLSLASAVLLMFVAVALLLGSETPDNGSHVGVYLLGNWATPFGIVLVQDRLSSLMLLLTASLALPALIYSGAGWDRRGRHFHSLFQFLLMGVNGAFLTGDLFNLFVFFEVLLVASYGLLLHGSGEVRVRFGLPYIAVNLVGSLFFLVGVSIIYGVAGTLNMADLAQKVPTLPEASRGLILAASALLGIVFAIKAAMYPLGFWLPGAYMAGAPPVGAIFAIMTKVGFYVLLRLSTLAFGEGTPVATGFGASALVAGGLATIAFGTLGILSAQGLSRVAANAVLVSSGTMLAALGLSGFTGVPVIGAALFYMLASTLAGAALFLIGELMERDQGSIAAILAVTAQAYGFADEDGEEEDEEDGEGLILPGGRTVLALCFVAITLLLAGLPPLAGFLGKFAMISGVFAQGPADGPIPAASWAFAALVIVSGFATMLAMLRIGIHSFWAGVEDSAPTMRATEVAPIVGLIAVALILTLEAKGAMTYLGRTAVLLTTPETYISAVMEASQATGFLPETEGNGSSTPAEAAKED